MDSPTSARRSTSMLDLAKRGIHRCHKRLRAFTRKHQSPPYPVCDDVLELIFSKMDVEERLRMGMLSHRTHRIVDRMPLTLEFLMVRSDGRGNYELHSDNIDLIIGHILDQCPGYRVTAGDSVIFNERFSNIIVNRILSRIHGVRQLWLESNSNDLVAELIVDFYKNLAESGCNRKFTMEQFTLVGSNGRADDMGSVSALITLAKKHLQTIRVRHVRMPTEADSISFWTAVAECNSLHQIQYEPCRLDKWSRPYLVDALMKKPLTSLIMTGVADLHSADVIRISSSGCLSELAVVGAHISPFTYSDSKAKSVIGKLDSLLLQLESGYNLDEENPRAALLQVLKTLPETAKLEVIHVNRGSVADTTKVLSYWLHLARDSNRLIKLKLEECSQERQDAAVGRLLRKSRESNKIEWAAKGLTLSCGCGRVILLDKQTWFGDEEE